MFVAVSVCSPPRGKAFRFTFCFFLRNQHLVGKRYHFSISDMVASIMLRERPV